MSNNEKNILSVLAAILLVSNVILVSDTSFSAHGQVTELPQGITIMTSADNFGKSFFGEGVIQVVIADPDANDEADDTVSIRIIADSQEGNGRASGTFTIPNTNPGSQKFEFFLVHAASQYADGIGNDGLELDPINNDGYDDLSNGFDGIGAPIIRIGADVGSGVELDTGDELYDEMRIEIRYDEQQVVVNYRETAAELETDRDSYGTDSLVYILIRDQDANLNPTEVDAFSATETGLDIIFGVSGASFGDDVTFVETSDNSAIFEGRFKLVDVDGPQELPSELVRASPSTRLISLTMQNLANYADPAAPENDSNEIDELSFIVDDIDGTLEDVEGLTFGGELRLVLNDNDQNKDSQDDETLDGVVTVRVANGDSNNNGIFEPGEADQELLDMEETDDNSGLFVIDRSNNELRITFLQDGASPSPNNGLLELRKTDIDKDIAVAYRDPLDDDSAISITASFTGKMALVDGSIDIPDAAGVNDDFFVTLMDVDLNDNPRNKDSYAVTLAGSSGTYGLKRSGATISELATLELEIAGDAPNFSEALNYTFVETEIDSGIFLARFDMRDILASSGIDTDDGDRLRISYNDLMDRTSRESSDTLVIGRSSTAIDFSRSALPIPPEDDPTDPAPESSVGGLVGTEVVTTLIITDVGENTQPNSENRIEFSFRNDPGNPRPAFSILIETGRISETIDTMTKYNGSDAAGELGNTGAFLSDILPELPSLRETGRSTGVFEDELRFVNDGSLDSDDWHDLQIIFTYYNDAGDNERAGITFRGNEGVLTTDRDSVMTGDIITLTVQDEDLNLDDSKIEEFRSSLDTDGIFLVAIVPEDDDLETRRVNAKSFRETGPDTGVFVASFAVGSDIPVAENRGQGDRLDINQATVIEITYNDEIDASGDSGDEIEIGIPVVTTTGSIQVMPDDKVGPGSRIIVLIADNDLNLNPRGADKLEGDSDGRGIVVFRTDRKDAGRASPDLQESGPSTGLFQFEIQLVPIEGGDEGELIEVDGGSDPKIGVLPGDLIAIRYEDENDENGNSVVVSRIIEVTSWDPVFEPNKESYEENDRVGLTISDPDANRNPDIADSIKSIRAYSESDRVGRVYSAIETDRDSGIFRLSFGLTTGTLSGAITTRNGEEVTVEYEDEFPGDYAERIKLTDRTDKKFFFTLLVGRALGNESATLSTPSLKDITGSEIAQVNVGEQILVTTTIQSSESMQLPFVALVEVRHDNGVSNSIQWQTGTLNPEEESEIGISWLPDMPGKYQLRAFVISDFESSRVLSIVVISEANVT